MRSIMEIEEIADSKISELTIWSHPAHITLSAIYNIIYELFFSEDADSLTYRFKGERIISYLSGIAPYIVRCGDSIIKIDEDRAIRFGEEMKLDLRSAIEYGQFCTIMDRLHKGEFCEEVLDGRIVLKFTNSEAFETEAHDVLISELSLPHFLQPKQIFDLSHAFRLGSGEAYFEPNKVAEQVRAQRHELERFDNDIEYVGDFSDVVEGIPDADYRALKISAMALALYIRSVSRLLQEAIHRGVLSGANASSRLIFWKAPCLKRIDLVHVLAKAASVTTESAEIFVDNFSLTIGGECPKWIKSGYFPPFQNLGERTIFSPAVLLVMMTNRNGIYVCSKKNEKVFHDVVSKRMEPKLVEDFLSVVPLDGGWECGKSVDFPGGEIDLVLFHRGFNIALQIQAKGSIAPEGAVLVRNFESRCEEGVGQLRRFDALSEEEKIAALRKKISAINSETLIVPCLLARGSFGRPEFLQRNRDILFINPFLANRVFRDDGFDWASPIEAMRLLRGQIFRHVNCVSSLEKFSVFENEVRVEMPVWDRKKLNDLKVSTTLSLMESSCR
jgi:hypothetical protein